MLLSGASNIASGVNGVLEFIVVTGVIIIGLVTYFMVYFVIKYSRKRHPRPREVRDSALLEVVWTVVPIGIVLVMFYIGWTNYVFSMHEPKNAMVVRVTGRQWSWLFTYENGKNSGILELPVGRPVKLAVTSADVIHGLFIPAFRIKQDAIPGVVNTIWFTPDKIGAYEILCSVYCGLGHSNMHTRAVIVTESTFDAWYTATTPAAAPTGTTGSRGEALIKRLGCTGCHTTNGTALIGPTYKGLYGSKVTVMTSGRERVVTADDAYIKTCITEPNVNLVKGFPPVMPSFKGRLTDRDIADITAYIKTLR